MKRTDSFNITKRKGLTPLISQKHKTVIIVILSVEILYLLQSFQVHSVKDMCRRIETRSWIRVIGARSPTNRWFREGLAVLFT